MVESMKNWTWAETGFVNWTCYWPMLFTLNTCRTMYVCVPCTYAHTWTCMYVHVTCMYMSVCMYILTVTNSACMRSFFATNSLPYLVWFPHQYFCSSMRACMCMHAYTPTYLRSAIRSFHTWKSLVHVWNKKQSIMTWLRWMKVVEL